MLARAHVCASGSSKICSLAVRIEATHVLADPHLSWYVLDLSTMRKPVLHWRAPFMSDSRFYKTEGIVIRLLPIGEADRIVTMFTPYHGKVRAVARGARRVKSRIGGHVELLSRVRVMIRRGKTLDVVSQAERIDGTMSLSGDLWRTTCGLYIAELIDRFTREELDNLALYKHLGECLAELITTSNIDLLVRYFELRMLSLVGFQPEVMRCVQCSGNLTPQAQFFSPETGGVICHSCRGDRKSPRPLSLSALKVLRLFTRSDLEKAMEVRVQPELAVELDHLLRQYIIHASG